MRGRGRGFLSPTPVQLAYDAKISKVEKGSCVNEDQ